MIEVNGLYLYEYDGKEEHTNSLCIVGLFEANLSPSNVANQSLLSCQVRSWSEAVHEGLVADLHKRFVHFWGQVHNNILIDGLG